MRVGGGYNFGLVCFFAYFLSFFLFSSLADVSILPIYLSIAGGLFCSGFNISCLLHIKKKKYS